MILTLEIESIILKNNINFKKQIKYQVFKLIERILNDFYLSLESEINSDYTNSLKELIESEKLNEEKLTELIIKEAF